jgi:hypothetical protein
MTECDVNIKEMLSDITFEKKNVPKSRVGDLLISLLKHRAFDAKSAILLSKYPVKEDDLEPFIKNDMIGLIQNSPLKVYLNDLGRLVAAGEFAIRQAEKEKKPVK